MHTQILVRLDRIDHMLDTLHAQLQYLPDELLNQKPGLEKWSILQVLHHLLIAEKLSAMYVHKKTSSGIDDIPKAPLSGYLRLASLRMTYLLPFKFKAPPAVGDGALPATSTLEETLAAWTQNRMRLRELLLALPENALKKAIYKHPIAGKLNAFQMLYFFDLHFRHHLGQIKRTLKAIQ